MVVHLYAEQADSGKESVCLKRDWIRGLIFSYAESVPKLFSETDGLRPLDVSIEKAVPPSRPFLCGTVHPYFMYKYIYTTALVILPVSALSLLFLRGVTPLPLSVAWSEEGVGMSLVFVNEAAEPAVGDRGARVETRAAEVSVYTLEEATRNGGELSYRISDTSGSVGGTPLIPAREFGGTVLLAVPVVGIWVRILAHPIGAAGLVGMPIVMLLIDLVVNKLRVGAMLRIRFARMRRAKEVRAREQAEYEQEDDASEYEENKMVQSGYSYTDEARHGWYETEHAPAGYTAQARSPRQTTPLSAYGEGMSVRIPPRRHTPARGISHTTVVGTGMKNIVSRPNERRSYGV